MLKALAGLKADKGLDCDVCLVLLRDGSHVCSYALLAVLCLDINLVQKADFLQLLLETALHSALNDLLRLICHLRIILNLRRKNFLLLLKVVRIDLGIARVERLQRCDLHCDILCHLLDRIVHDIGLDRKENADLTARMDIGLDKAVLLLELTETTNVKLLADHGNHSGELLLHREGVVCLPRLCEESLEICSIGIQRLLCNLADIVSELLVLRDEVGLCIHLDRNALLAVSTDKNSNHALCCDTARLLLRACKSLLTKELNRLFHVALDCRESLLAVHHACAGKLSEFLNHCRCNCAHLLSPLALSLNARLLRLLP